MTTYQVRCDFCERSYLTTDDTGVMWCGCPQPAPTLPPHARIVLPAAVGKLLDYTLPDVPLDEQVFVSDPLEHRWLHVVHRDHADAMRDWLAWYHEPPA